MVAHNKLLPALQNLLQSIQTLKQRDNITLVRLLRRRKPTLVHPIVDRVVDPLVLLLDLGLEVRREEVDFGELVGEERVELGVEEAEDLGGFVVDDRVGLLVPKSGNGYGREVAEERAGWEEGEETRSEKADTRNKRALGTH